MSLKLSGIRDEINRFNLLGTRAMTDTERLARLEARTDEQERRLERIEEGRQPFGAGGGR